MIPTPHPPLAERPHTSESALGLASRRRFGLTPEEVALRQVRRRLFRYILETHHRRLSRVGRGFGEQLVACEA